MVHKYVVKLQMLASHFVVTKLYNHLRMTLWNSGFTAVVGYDVTHLLPKPNAINILIS